MIPSYFGAALPVNSKTTLLPWAVTDFAGAPNVSFQRPALSIDGYFLARLKVNATSWAVNGLPSLHLTPSRMSRVSFVAPSQVDFVASHGVSSQVRLLRTMSGSYSQFPGSGLGGVGVLLTSPPTGASASDGNVSCSIMPPPLPLPPFWLAFCEALPAQP